MTNPLSPRDIQTRIRSGASLEELAREADVPVERIEPYAAPVLAEREHVAGTALQCPVRRRGETGSVRAMRAVVGEKLASRSIDIDDVEWDAWRNEDRRWTVVGRYSAGDQEHEALFIFDQRARFSIATNDEARWLIGEHTAIPGPAPVGTMDSPDAEPTIDLNDELALIRAIQGAAAAGHQVAPEIPEPTPVPRPSTSPAPVVEHEAPTSAPRDEVEARDAQEQTSQEQASQVRRAQLETTVEPHRVVVRESITEVSVEATDEEEVEDYAPAELEQVDGVYDIVPSNTNDMDVLYEMLSSFAEDSVNIYAGLTGPVAPAAEPGGSEDEQGDDIAPRAPHRLQIPTGQAERELQQEQEQERPMQAWAAQGDAEPPVAPQQDAPAPSQVQDVADEEHDPAAEPVVAADEDLEPEVVETSESRAEQAWNSFHSSRPAHQVTVNEEALAQRRRASESASQGEQAAPPPVRRRAEPSSADDEGTEDRAQGVATPRLPRHGQPAEPVQPVHEAETSQQPASRPSRGDEAPAAPAEPVTPEPVTPEPVAPEQSPASIAERAAAAEAGAIAEASAAQQQPPVEPEQKPKPKPRPKKKRASVPSWDEIMFGGPTPGSH